MRIDIVLEEIKKVKNFSSLKSFIDHFTRAHHIKHFSYFINHYAKTQMTGPMMFWNYPQEITEIYQLKKYFALDPVVEECFAATMPFSCSHQLYSHRINDQQHEFFIDFETHEIKNGIACPIHAPNGEMGGMCYVVDDIEGAFQKNAMFNQWELLSFTLICHEAARKLAANMGPNVGPQVKLAPREAECLIWSARGKTSYEIGIILGLSEKTVNTYLKSCYAKLNVSNKPQAIAKAITNGDIAWTETNAQAIHFLG